MKGDEITFAQTQQEDFICITDITEFKNPEAPRDIIKNWMRNKSTIALLGLWKNFKQVKFDLFKNDVGFNHFVLYPQKWISSTALSSMSANKKEFDDWLNNIGVHTFTICESRTELDDELYQAYYEKLKSLMLQAAKACEDSQYSAEAKRIKKVLEKTEIGRVW